MGVDLSPKERDAIRTPMQWSSGPNAGFSIAKKKSDLHHPVITGGDFGYETVNVEAQRCDPGSLLHWMEQMLHTLRECPEFGIGKCRPVDTGDPAVLAGALAALRRRAGRVVWLNPLLGSPGYEPLTRGMQAALPHVDVFAPVHNLESLERLVPHLSL